MLNRQSVISPEVWEAAMSRSATAKRSAISRALGLCGLSHPFFDQSSKVGFISNQENLGTRHDFGKEMAPFGKFTTEFGCLVDRGVHLAPKFGLSGSHRADNPVHGETLANNQDIYVASGTLLSSRHRSVDK